MAWNKKKKTFDFKCPNCYTKFTFTLNDKIKVEIDDCPTVEYLPNYYNRIFVPGIEDWETTSSFQ